MKNSNFTLIVKVLRMVFILIFFLNIISHSQVLITLQKNILDIQNILSLCLILSFIFVNRVTTFFLIFHCINIFSMTFFPKLFSESAYFSVFIGLDLSSFVRMNITNTYWIVNPIMNLSFYLVGYIIFLEIPYRLYKRNFFTFNKKS